MRRGSLAQPEHAHTCPPVEVSAVIPIVPWHLVFLPRLVASINKQHCCFKQVVAVASGGPVTHLVTKLFMKAIRGAETLTLKGPLASSGKNRNVGFRSASARVVAFLDADDVYEPNRNCVIRTVFAGDEVAGFLHSYYKLPNTRFRKSGGRSTQSFEIRECFDNDAFRLAHPLRLDSSTPPALLRGKNFNLEFTDAKVAFPIAHGHLTVAKELIGGVTFHEHTGILNEDTLVVCELFQQGKKILVSAAELSGYQPRRLSWTDELYLLLMRRRQT